MIGYIYFSMADKIEESRGFQKCKTAMVNFGFDDKVNILSNASIIDYGLRILLIEELHKKTD